MTSRRALRAFEIHEFDYEQRMVAEVQLDHKHIPGDSFKYNGYSSRADRISILGITGLILGDMLWTDLGKRHAKDAETFRTRTEDRIALTARIDQLVQERLRLAPTGRSRTVSAEYHTMTAEIESLREQRDNVDRHLVALQFDPDYEIAIPDEVEEVPKVNLKMIEREVRDGTPDAVRLAPARSRNWITVKEFAALLNVSTKTVTRVIDPAKYAPTAGVRTRKRAKYWNPDAPPVDSTLGNRHLRILVDEIFPTTLAVPERQAALNRLLAGPPQEQWGPVCMEIPCIPDYARREGADEIAA
jgi:hypothetical protein